MRRIWIGMVLAGLAVGGLAGSAGAAISPQIYEEMRQGAPYVLILRIQSVDRSKPKVEGATRAVPVTVRARILSVIRGRGVEKGRTITITYTHRPLPKAKGWAGRAPIPVPRSDTRVLAWLKRSGSGFAPAALGRSFEWMR